MEWELASFFCSSPACARLNTCSKHVLTHIPSHKLLSELQWLWITDAILPFISEPFRTTWPTITPCVLPCSRCMSRFGVWKSGWAKTQPGRLLATALHTGTRVFLQLSLQLYFMKLSCKFGLLICIHGLPTCPTAQNISNKIIHSIDKEVTYQQCHDKGPSCFQEKCS